MANYSGLFDGVFGEPYSLLSGRSPNRYHLRRIMRKRGMAEYAQILREALDDSTPASTATKIVAQVAANADTTANVQGGARTITNQQLQGLLITSLRSDTAANTARAITAADVTDLQGDLPGSGQTAVDGDNIHRAPTDGSGTITYPTDASGNGGGGKQPG